MRRLIIIFLIVAAIAEASLVFAYRNAPALPQPDPDFDYGEQRLLYLDSINKNDSIYFKP